MIENEDLNQINEKLDEMNRRLDNMEGQLRHYHATKSRGDMSWIWAFVPIAAIVMWGLTNIL